MGTLAPFAPHQGLLGQKEGLLGQLPTQTSLKYPEKYRLYTDNLQLRTAKISTARNICTAKIDYT